MSLLEVRNLRTVFASGHGEVAAVDDVSFALGEREVLGIVGESGSGKSVTALSIMGLLPKPPARIASGAIWFAGENLLTLNESRMRRVRGPGIGMIFQEPMTSLNPIFSIGNQLMETVGAHERLSPRARRERAITMLAKVGIAAPERRLDDYPHQLSGGMRQRVMIAMALACNPKLLIADEPTTALDVTIQAQILELLLSLRDELGMAVIIITHNMGVVTRGLLDSIPSIDDERERLRTIPGMLPNPAALPPGCRFAPRCFWRIPACAATTPPLDPAGAGYGADHDAACIRLAELGTP